MVSYGEGSETNLKSQSVWNKGQKKLFKALAPQFLQGLTEGATNYPKQMFVPTTSEEQTYFDTIPQLASELGAYRANLSKPAYEINANTTEQYYQKAIRDPALKEFANTTLPTINEAYSGPGYWGSARAQAIATGIGDVEANLATQRAELYYNDELSRRSSLEAAAQREAQFGAVAIGQEADMLGTAGQYARSIAQEEVTADLQRWLMGDTVDGVRANEYNPYITLALQALGITSKAVGAVTSGGGSYGVSGSIMSGFNSSSSASTANKS